MLDIWGWEQGVVCEPTEREEESGHPPQRTLFESLFALKVMTFTWPGATSFIGLGCPRNWQDINSGQGQLHGCPAGVDPQSLCTGEAQAGFNDLL